MFQIERRPQVLEADIERIFGQEVAKLGGLSWKWVSPGNNGVPDRIVMIPGHPAFFVEFKAERGKLSAIQKQQHYKMKRAGTKPIVIRGMKDVKRFFETLGYPETASFLGMRYGI